MGKDYTENVQLFKAFCDENRWRILEILQEGERCACVLLNELEISQSTLSHHMRILCDSGVVVGRKEGKWIHYSISESGMEKAKRRIDQLLEQSIRPSTAVKGIERDRLTEKTKLYVLTGFLGSGKTTVLLRLLEALKGIREKDLTGERLLTYKILKEVLEKEQAGVPFEELELLTLGGLRKAVVDGDVTNGSVMAGQSAAMVKEILSCEEIIQNLTEQAEKLLKGVSKHE